MTFQEVDTNNLESVEKGKKMTTKRTNKHFKKKYNWMDDGDDAHFVPIHPKHHRKVAAAGHKSAAKKKTPKMSSIRKQGITKR